MAFEDLKKAYSVITNTNSDKTNPFNKAGNSIIIISTIIINTIIIITIIIISLISLFQ